MAEFDVFEWAEENKRLAEKSFERFKEEYKLDKENLKTQGGQDGK